MNKEGSYLVRRSRPFPPSGRVRYQSDKSMYAAVPDPSAGGGKGRLRLTR